MKVVYIAPMELPVPCEKGAIEEIIWQLSRRLKNFVNVYIYNPTTSNNVYKLVKGLKPLAYQCDDCIIHSHNLYASLSISLLCKRLKHILTLHYPPTPPTVTKSKRRGKILRKILQFLDATGTVITAPSLYIKESLKHMGIKKAIFIPNGVDTSMFNPVKYSEELRERLLEGKDILIVNVGRIHPEKNQLALLVAFNELVNRYGYRNVKLVLIGPTSGTFRVNKESPYYRLLAEYIQKHDLKSYVTFTELPRSDVAKVLASSDIYVHPSKVEAAAPLAVLEAMACRLPIVAFNLQYYRYYLINNFNSLLIPPNVRALTKSLLTLIEEGQLASKLAENAYNSAIKHFSWNSITKFYIKTYDVLVSYGEE